MMAVPSNGSPVDKNERRERLRVLLAFMERERKILRTRLSEILGYHESALSQAANSETRGPSPGIREAFWKKLGLELRYWDNPERLSPQECLRPERVRSQTEIDGAFARQRMLQIAKRRADSPGVIAELATLEPSPGSEGDAFWWLERYFEILARHSGARRTGTPR